MVGRDLANSGERFYEDQGFKLLGTFSAKKNNTETWDGALLKMDLSSEI
jgi:hypothetical protein